MNIGNTWHFQVINGLNPVYLYEDTLKILSDTVIGAKTYYKSNDLDMYYFPHLKYLRADSNSVFMISKTTGKEEPLFKFDLSAGDSFSTSLGEISLLRIEKEVVFNKEINIYSFGYTDHYYYFYYGVSREFGFNTIGVGDQFWTKSYNLEDCIINNPINIIEANEKNAIANYKLMQNYPNPFNPITTIEVVIPKSSYTTLKIFNALGEEVETLVSNRLERGVYYFNWNGSSHSSGVYFYLLRSNNYFDTKKLLLVK